MPAEKRKCDEDTWIVTQSKKFKCGQLLSNVYESTLAQLRMGARNFFQTKDVTSSVISPPTSPNGNQTNGSPISSPPASPVMIDVISHSDILLPPVVNIRPTEICQNCVFKKDGWEKCYYCEKLMCHSNPCEGCHDGFCSNCCIAKYDNPSGETFTCYRCIN